MDNQQEQRYRCILLQTMKNFVKLCKENNIKYVAAYGTILGAVRHKGLIPWDDDIDVYMTRENYEKFMSLKNSPLLTGYEIIDFRDDGYYLPFAKFCDKHTTLWEIKKYPFVMGVFIDIFPLDMANLDEKSRTLHHQYKNVFNDYLKCISHYDIKDYGKALLNLQLKSVLRMLKEYLFFASRKKNVLQRMENILNEIQSVKGDFYLYHRSFAKFEKSLFPKEYIEDVIEFPFEDFTIYIPRQYDAVLTQMYGDYMTLPPVEQQKSQHFHFYFNPTERLSIKEITERMNK